MSTEQAIDKLNRSNAFTLEQKRALRAAFGLFRGFTGGYYMDGNTTATTVSVIDTWYKAAGATTAFPGTSALLGITDNRITYNGEGSATARVVFSATVAAGINDVIDVSVHKNGTLVEGSGLAATMDGNGDGENITGSAVVPLEPGDYVEIFVANESGTTNITVSELSVTIGTYG